MNYDDVPAGLSLAMGTKIATGERYCVSDVSDYGEHDVSVDCADRVVKKCSPDVSRNC